MLNIARIVAMEHFDCDASAITGFGQVANSATLDSILLYMRALRQDTQQIQIQNQSIMDRILAIESRVQELHPGAGAAPDVADVTITSVAWQCPVCGLVLQDAATFKGHIRRLVHTSSRPRCHLNPSDDNHKVLISRFGADEDDFHRRQQLFSRAFYGFVRVVISAKYDENDSFTLITSWIAAAMSSGLAFPEVPVTSGSSTSAFS